jgi:hypothetical protein
MLQEHMMMQLGHYAVLMLVQTLNCLSLHQILGLVVGLIFQKLSLSRLRTFAGRELKQKGFSVLKAKLLDGKGLRVLPSANCSSSVQPDMIANISHKNNSKRELASTASITHGVGTVNAIQDPGSSGSGKGDLVLDLDHGDMMAGHVAAAQWSQPCQTTATANMEWPSEPASYEVSWATQMNHIYVQAALFTSSTTIATSAWPLSATTQPSFDSTYPYPCATELLMNKISRTMTTNMPSPQIDGPTEGVWSAEQQFLHCDNSGWTGANSSSWDPFLLYPQC